MLLLGMMVVVVVERAGEEAATTATAAMALIVAEILAGNDRRWGWQQYPIRLTSACPEHRLIGPFIVYRRRSGQLHLLQGFTSQKLVNLRLQFFLLQGKDLRRPCQVSLVHHLHVLPALAVVLRAEGLRGRIHHGAHQLHLGVRGNGGGGAADDHLQHRYSGQAEL
ncbi:hypothetical protein TYRP_009739 [Tyrophagus putrescentiae]|nr:hypothetical protein TYRP_009739 [Tyrophagus putrescentiae]